MPLEDPNPLPTVSCQVCELEDATQSTATTAANGSPDGGVSLDLTVEVVDANHVEENPGLDDSHDTAVAVELSPRSVETTDAGDDAPSALGYQITVRVEERSDVADTRESRANSGSDGARSTPRTAAREVLLPDEDGRQSTD